MKRPTRESCGKSRNDNERWGREPHRPRTLRSCISSFRSAPTVSRLDLEQWIIQLPRICAKRGSRKLAHWFTDVLAGLGLGGRGACHAVADQANANPR